MSIRELRVTRAKIFAWALRAMSLTIALVVVLIGCGRHAWRHAQRIQRFRTYVFVWRFNEAMGVAWILSLIGAANGALQVISAQLFLVWKHTEEPAARPLADREASG